MEIQVFILALQAPVRVIVGIVSETDGAGSVAFGVKTHLAKATMLIWVQTGKSFIQPDPVRFVLRLFQPALRSLRFCRCLTAESASIRKETRRN